MDRTLEFQHLRPTLFGLAYRMLGMRADAEDVVQEAWLRWEGARTDEVRNPKAFLTTTVARLSLDALKSAHRRRESYLGNWLPEPLLDATRTQPVELAESLSLAFLHILESLSPAERAAFLLREVFDTEYEDVADALETTAGNARQLVKRAREHLRDRRPRFPVDRDHHQQILREFAAACMTGDPSRVAGLLTENVAAYSDGGGKAPSPINALTGQDRVSRFLAGVAKKGAAGLQVHVADVNGQAGLLLLSGSRPVSIVTVDVDELGRIRAIFIVNNPDKLPGSFPEQLA
jgi:RNA polymerase sigma-70 factor (ECF subfamily)